MSLYLIRRVNQNDLLLRLGVDQNRRPGGVQLVGIIQSLVFFHVRVLGAIVNSQVRTVLYNGTEEIPMHTQNGYTMFFSVQEKSDYGIRPHEIIYY